MKLLISCSSAFLVGLALGFYVRGIVEPIYVHNSGVMSSTNHADFPLEAFVRVNSELPALIDSITGEFASNRFIVCVVPHGFGTYEIVIPEPSRAQTLTESQRDKLIQLIHQRVDDYSHSTSRDAR